MQTAVHRGQHGGDARISAVRKESGSGKQKSTSDVRLQQRRDQEYEAQGDGQLETLVRQSRARAGMKWWGGLSV